MREMLFNIKYSLKYNKRIKKMFSFLVSISFFYISLCLSLLLFRGFCHLMTLAALLEIYEVAEALRGLAAGSVHNTMEGLLNLVDFMGC